MNTAKAWAVAAALLAFAGFAAIDALGAEVSPVGVWRSIDDKTKQERSIIRITQ